MLVGLFGKALLPITNAPRINALFPSSSQFRSEVPDAVLDRGILPVFRLMAWLMSRLRVAPTRQYPVVLVVRVRRAAVAFALEIRGVNDVRSLVMDAARCRGAGCRAAAIGRH